MTTQDYEEGYADGLAGAGMQERDEQPWMTEYESGFMDGSVDRKRMLAR